MKKLLKLSLLVGLLAASACQKDFLETVPLGAPSDATFWTSEANATLWVNNLYRELPKVTDFYFDSMSDNATASFGGEDGGVGSVANGSFEPTTGTMTKKWGYAGIRNCLELLARIDEVPNLTEPTKAQFKAQARFVLAFRYFELITLYRDVPLVDKVLPLEEADVPKSEKSVVLKYLLEQLELAIVDLPLTWPAKDNGRATKGAALTLKARVMLFNNRWAEAAAAAKAVMDLGVYQLHPKYGELFLTVFNNKTKEVILAYQYAELVPHNLSFQMPFQSIGGTGSSMPLPGLVNSYESKDGLPITESPLYDPKKPQDNRDPRFNETFIWPFQTFAGVVYDPINNAVNKAGAKTYVFQRKYVNDIVPQQRVSWVNWTIFRYADVLLMYAEAQNEASGPNASVYDALDLIRVRAGMPKINRSRYATQATLREAIRNERRVELAGEGLRYYDIIRWRIAEKTQNTVLYSVEVPGSLPRQTIETRVFNPARHYVWPIPQSAIDRAKNLVQHPEWK